MKNILILSFFVLLSFSAFSQKLDFAVKATYDHAFKSDKLQKAESLSDVINGYPSSWITDYISTSITTTCHGTVLKSKGSNEMLTEEQKNNLSTADLGSDVIIEVNYRYQNSAIEQVDIHQLYFKATVVPEIEAEYSGGYEQMQNYLKETAIDKIDDATARQMKPVLVSFTINEEGEVSNAEVSSSSGDEKIDKLLLKTIQKMPRWKPAENLNGTKVKQDFMFSVGVPGC